MEKFSFKVQKDLMIPQTDLFRPPTDKDGNKLSGDDLLKSMAVCAERFEKENGRPVPIGNQRFVAWLKQAKKALESGMSSDEYFAKTISPAI